MKSKKTVLEQKARCNASTEEGLAKCVEKLTNMSHIDRSCCMWWLTANAFDESLETDFQIAL